MITGINHIGIAVSSIDKTLDFLSKTMGAKELRRKKLPEMGQTSCLVSVGNLTYELMEPLGEGIIANFLSKNGEGFHHISLDSNNLDKDCTVFEENGVKMVSRFKTVAFTHPKTTGGILYEITSGFEE